MGNAPGGGEYVAVLTDRHAVRPSMLKVLSNHLRAESPDLVVWNVASGYSKQYRGERTARYTGTLTRDEPLSVLKRYLTFSGWKSNSLFLNDLPRSLNSLYKNQLASSIRRKHGRLYFPFTPDYTSAFLLLANAKTFQIMTCHSTCRLETVVTVSKLPLKGSHATHLRTQEKTLSKAVPLGSIVCLTLSCETIVRCRRLSQSCSLCNLVRPIFPLPFSGNPDKGSTWFTDGYAFLKESLDRSSAYTTQRDKRRSREVSSRD